MLLADPTLAPIEQKKTFGLWPPSKDNIADSMYPYVKKMNHEEKIKILLVGDPLGEDAARFLELDENEKIKKIRILDDTFGDVGKENIKDKEKIGVISTKDFNAEKYDFVFINSENKPLDEVMKTYYNSVKSHGIFCGNNHHKDYVKEALAKFRRGNKIGTPILVSNRLCWFWIKR